MRDNRTKEERILQLGFIAGTDIGGKVAIVEDKRGRRGRGRRRRTRGSSSRRGRLGDGGVNSRDDGGRNGGLKGGHGSRKVSRGKAGSRGRRRDGRGRVRSMGSSVSSREKGVGFSPSEHIEARTLGGSKADVVDI